MTRYHPFLVALHWLIALMIILALIFGSTQLAGMPNDDPAKIAGLRAHMSLGIAVLVLMLIRLATRLFTAKPPHASTGNALLDRAGVATHWLFYILVIAMAGSGLATARMAGLPEIVFGGSGAPLPEDFRIYPPRIAHGIIATLLGLLLLLHVAAALYHQFVRKDGLFARMWFGDRRA
ncbi:MAG: cytochrome b/b6 domain-containing protein [Rhodobacter sp.]|nr:cytochrome b/b6 domain-containing protein [Rhodobacter sp.]